ncbi:glucose-1-phosphate adenylyltransferase [Bacillus massilinigeriensis]|uniref:glucose-1-phosphate adenylyltransferase n=1 Tax=Bacillus mediterraneensis TaxID=1805474 RepID=UPI0008F83CF8|nr:glucose-1-phosphate adenylyltransferase [Bacillus mediterraneensis]
MAKKELIAMILAGGRGSRLRSLTENIAKPAVSFGGKYRIIDFPLSNCIHSEVETVGILTQYQPHTLQKYINDGKIWGFDRYVDGITFLPPFQCKTRSRWYEGTAHAVAQNREFISFYDPDYVIVLSGDHIYKMDYRQMLKEHKKSGADVSISVIPVPWSEANRFGILCIDPVTGRIHEFEEKPQFPASNMASMGIYIFNWRVLRNIIEVLDDNPLSFSDFGKDVIPYMLAEGFSLYAYMHEGYWKDVGTLESLWEANMDLLTHRTNILMDNKKWSIFTSNQSIVPAYIDEDALVRQSFISEGSEIYGKVFNSVISYAAKVEKGAVVRNSVLLPNAVVGKNTIIENAIIGERLDSGDNNFIYRHKGDFRISM